MHRNHASDDAHYTMHIVNYTSGRRFVNRACLRVCGLKEKPALRFAKKPLTESILQNTRYTAKRDAEWTLG